MTNDQLRSIAGGFLLLAAAMAVPVTTHAQDCRSILSSCRGSLGDCNARLGAYTSITWRDMLTNVIEQAIAELTSKGVTLSEATHEAAKSKDVHAQLTALNEVVTRANELATSKSSKLGAAQKLDTTRTTNIQTVAPQQVNQAVKQKQVH